jgi:hypothetical protein
MPIKIIAFPVGEQIDLAMARLHLRLDDDGDSPAAHPDDVWLTGVGIPAAREYCEGWLGRALAPHTLELGLDSFTAPYTCTWHGQPCSRISSESSTSSMAYSEILLPMPPVVSVASVKYYDGDGTLQTLSTDAYYVDDYAGRIVLVDGTSWPTTSVRPNAVLIRYHAGYSLPGDSPDTNPLSFGLKAAMLLVLGALYENREDQAGDVLTELPLGAKALMMPYKVRLGMA